jgi:hypothetical protein
LNVAFGDVHPGYGKSPAGQFQADPAKTAAQVQTSGARRTIGSVISRGWGSLRTVQGKVCQGRNAVGNRRNFRPMGVVKHDGGKALPKFHIVKPLALIDHSLKYTLRVGKLTPSFDNFNPTCHTYSMKTHTLLFALPLLFFLSCTGTKGTEAAEPNSSVAGTHTSDGPFRTFTLEKHIAGESGLADDENSGLDISLNLVDGKEASLQSLIRGLLYGNASPEQYAQEILKIGENSYGNYAEEHTLVSAGSFAVISRIISIYEGGAHPNYTVESYVIDLEQLRRLEIDDIIIKEGFSNLNTFIDGELRLFSEEQTGEELPPWEPLSKGIFFEDTIPPLTNISPGTKGLSFHWNPYAMAPYSSGIVEVTIPWNLLEDLLSPRGRDLEAAFKD